MQVKTLTGYTAISTIKLNDLVYSKDELTGITSYQKVLAHYSNPYQETVYLTVKDATGHLQTIVSNKIHPYFTVTHQQIESSEGHRYSGGITGGQWVDASKLQQGFKLLDESGLWQEVVSVQIKPEPLQAYNLTIDQTHTYFIKGVNGVEGVWVHNDCWDKLPADAVPTGKTTPDAEGRPLYTFKDKDGKQVTAYQGSDGRWYDPKVYPPTKPTATGAKAQSLKGELKFESSAKHHENSSGYISKPPTNPQKTLESSVQISDNTTRRVGYDPINNEFAVFDETYPRSGIYHGHVRLWEQLSQDMKNILVKAGVVNQKGKPIK